MVKAALITGGTGFIGSHLCDRFLKEGYKVVCMDNLITGSLSNVSRFESNRNFKFIRHDVSTYIDIKDEIDIVLHFASPASPIDYLNYPIQTLKVGSLGTHNALGIAKSKKAKFVLASTSEVYGDPQEHPQKETYYGHVNCIGPRGVYDEAKRFAEAITFAYHKTHNIPIHICRIFNTYGPRMRKNDGRAIPNFITQALKNESITVYGEGTQTRSFCYIDDLIDGIYLLSQSKVHGPINLGNPNEVKIIDIAKEIIKLTESKSKIVYGPLPEDDPKVRRPDIENAKRLLNWKPKIDLQQGLEVIIKWFSDELTR